MTKKSKVLAAMAVAAFVAALALVAFVRGGSSTSGTALAAGSPAVQPSDTATTLPWPTDGRPTPSYTPDARSAVRSAYADFVQCMGGQGITGFTPLPDSYGDGKTPTAVQDASTLNPDTPEYRAATTACADQLKALNQTTLAANGK